MLRSCALIAESAVRPRGGAGEPTNRGERSQDPAQALSARARQLTPQATEEMDSGADRQTTSDRSRRAGVALVLALVAAARMARGRRDRARPGRAGPARREAVRARPRRVAARRPEHRDRALLERDLAAGRRGGSASQPRGAGPGGAGTEGGGARSRARAPQRAARPSQGLGRAARGAADRDLQVRHPRRPDGGARGGWIHRSARAIRVPQPDRGAGLRHRRPGSRAAQRDQGHRRADPSRARRDRGEEARADAYARRARGARRSSSPRGPASRRRCPRSIRTSSASRATSGTWRTRSSSSSSRARRRRYPPDRSGAARAE